MRPSTPERDRHPLTMARTGTPPAAGSTAAGAARAIPEVPCVPGGVRLFARTHIDLRRVAGALCRS
ncbi:putative leader peptide [Streptomyces collinus]|uniref:putative leader peptide n=1 Tax=Streptomyces collinus TaxID=42684 RepID=UPI0029429086|nr:putative leader peptide [Streptomyces collinus]